MVHMFLFEINSCTFAAARDMRNPALKREISAWLLLAVFLPVLALSSVHVHSHTDLTTAECADCLNHSCHGHLTVMDSPLHQCVLCQFLTLSYVAAASIAVVAYDQPQHRLSSVSRNAVIPGTHGVPSLRAPPASVLN